MQGHDVEEIDRNGQPKEGDRLIIEPKKLEKHIPQIDFKKQEGRPEDLGQNDSGDGPEGDVLLLNPYPDPKPPNPPMPNVGFGGQA